MQYFVNYQVVKQKCNFRKLRIMTAMVIVIIKVIFIFFQITKNLSLLILFFKIEIFLYWMVIITWYIKQFIILKITTYLRTLSFLPIAFLKPQLSLWSQQIPLQVLVSLSRRLDLVLQSSLDHLGHLKCFSMEKERDRWHHYNLEASSWQTCICCCF